MKVFAVVVLSMMLGSVALTQDTFAEEMKDLKQEYRKFNSVQSSTLEELSIVEEMKTLRLEYRAWSKKRAAVVLTEAEEMRALKQEARLFSAEQYLTRFAEAQR